MLWHHCRNTHGLSLSLVHNLHGWSFSNHPSIFYVQVGLSFERGFRRKGDNELCSVYHIIIHATAIFVSISELNFIEHLAFQVMALDTEHEK